MHSRFIITGTLLVFMVSTIYPQEQEVYKSIAASVLLDSVVITATRQGFDVEDFIRLVQNDNSLYIAFRNLRTASHRFETEMLFEDRSGDIRATYTSSNRQEYNGRCRTMQTIDESWSGDIYKGKKQRHRYYTMELYDRLFLTHGKVCGDSEINPSEPDLQSSDGDKAIEGQVSELKKLIFSPGERSGVALIGRKTAVFSEEMLPYYDFSISGSTYGEIPVYIFLVSVKRAFAQRENKTVFKELETVFSREDFQVLARRYTLSHRTVAFRFDVTMDVDLIRQGDRYFPQRVQYDGEWNIPTRRRETGKFVILFDEFR